jgi:hypothetical protein
MGLIDEYRRAKHRAMRRHLYPRRYSVKGECQLQFGNALMHTGRAKVLLYGLRIIRNFLR